MKSMTIAMALLATSVLPAAAVGLDEENFGVLLNGWRDNRTAIYSINSATFITFRPTVTNTSGGGLFVSTRIEEGSRGQGASCVLELKFSRQAQLVGAQIRMIAGEQRLDTGFVKRQAAPAPSDSGEGDGPASVPTETWSTPTGRLVDELFTRLDNEIAKQAAASDGKPVRRDIFGRVKGRGTDSPVVPAALRHNLNLLLANVR